MKLSELYPADPRISRFENSF